MADTRVLTIGRLGHAGDGVAETEAGPVYVPFALPGEIVRAEVAGERGTLVEVLSPSPRRAAPPCPHFGACGGCALQHLDPETYSGFKRGLVEAAFAARGQTPEIRESHAVAPGARRRAVFAAERQNGRLLFGYHARMSHRIVEITTCPVLDPAVVAALPALRRVTERLLPRGSASVTVTVTRAGLDVAFRREGARGAREIAPSVIAELARLPGIARVTLDGEVLVERARPEIAFGDVSIVLPPGGFLQAAASAEAALAGLVLDAVGGARRVADLFAGAGTFTLRLARRSAVHAVESDAAGLAALAAAARGAKGLKPITTEKRDLFRRPLEPSELARFDAVVFDPPRAGAAAQAEMLAKSAVPIVVAVSCNPATLARDARTLADGGYVMGPVTPVDQFLYAPHVELVAAFRHL